MLNVTIFVGRDSVKNWEYVSFSINFINSAIFFREFIVSTPSPSNTANEFKHHVMVRIHHAIFNSLPFIDGRTKRQNKPEHRRDKEVGRSPIEITGSLPYFESVQVSTFQALLLFKPLNKQFYVVRSRKERGSVEEKKF